MRTLEVVEKELRELRERKKEILTRPKNVVESLEREAKLIVIKIQEAKLVHEHNLLFREQKE
jgi:hypothetical protein